MTACLCKSVQAYDERQNQMTIDSYLSFSQRFAKFKSKRLQQAVTGITGVHDPELNLGDLSEPSMEVAARGRKRKAAPATIPEEPADGVPLLSFVESMWKWHQASAWTRLSRKALCILPDTDKLWHVSHEYARTLLGCIFNQLVHCQSAILECSQRCCAVRAYMRC